MFQPILLGEIVLFGKSVFLPLKKVAGKGQNSTKTDLRGPRDLRFMRPRDAN